MGRTVVALFCVQVVGEPLHHGDQHLVPRGVGQPLGHALLGDGQGSVPERSDTLKVASVHLAHEIGQIVDPEPTFVAVDGLLHRWNALSLQGRIDPSDADSIP